MPVLTLHISGDLVFWLFGRYMIGYYGLLILLGVAAAVLLAHHQCRVHGKSFDEAVELTCVGGLCGLLGAKLLYLAVSFSSIDWARLFSDATYATGLIGGGFVFYGGVLGALLGIAVYGRLRKIDAWGLVNACAPCLPLAHAFGRLGCLVAGCCYGVPWDGPVAVVYDHSPLAPNGVTLFPVQLAEALLNLVLSGVLVWACNRWRRPELRPCAEGSRAGGAAGVADTASAASATEPGEVPARGVRHGLALYLLLYGVERFFLEFARYDSAERGFLGPLSTSQWISLALVVGCAAFFVVQSRRRRG